MAIGPGVRTGDWASASETESLLEQALVHSSWLHEHPDAARGHNERLEFLGDAVVNLAISEALYARHPDDDEGDLTARRAAIVSTAGLARLAARIDLGDVPPARRGRGPARRPAAGRRSWRRPSRRRGRALPRRRVRAASATGSSSWPRPSSTPSRRSARSRAPRAGSRSTPSARSGERPVYRSSTRPGPDHERSFRIEVSVDGEVLGVGEGPSRRVAETAAAAQAMDRLRARPSRTEAGPGA